MAGLTVSTAALIGTLLEMMLFGTFIPLGLTCFLVFHHKHKSGGMGMYQFVTFLIITLGCIMHVIVNTYRTVKAFANPSGPDGQVEIGAHDLNLGVLLNSLSLVETVIADLFIIWRVWVVWGKKWWVAVLPSVLLVGSTVGGVYLVYSLSQISDGASASITSHLQLGQNLFSYFTLFLNLWCTIMIFYKIWSVRRNISSGSHRGSKTSASDPVQRVINNVVESAAMYTLLLIAVIVSSSTNSPTTFIFTNLISPTIAIVFSTIILRSTRGTAFGDTSNLTSSGPTPGRTPHNGHSLYELRSRVGGEEEAARKTLQAGVQIHLNRVVTQKVDGTDSLHNPETAEDKYDKQDV